MGATLLIGGADYPLDDRAVGWLVETIRASCVNDAGVPLDDSAAACLLLADEIVDVGEDEPIELGRFATEGPSVYVMRDYLVQDNDGLVALFYALRRVRGDPI